MKEDIRYSEAFKIRTHEVGSDMKMTLPSLLKVMQEASMQNAIDLKFSIWDMSETNGSWVLVRKSFFVERYPEYGETITVKTYPSGFEKIFAYRDFKVYDAQEMCIAWASSTWTLMNLESRRIMRLPNGFDKLILPEEEKILTRAESKNIPLETRQYAFDYEIGRYDLDWNNHVNNMVYVRRMLEPLPSGFTSTRKPVQLNYQIKAECHLGDVIEISCQQISEMVVSHQITSQSTNKVVATANSYWIER